MFHQLEDFSEVVIDTVKLFLRLFVVSTIVVFSEELFSWASGITYLYMMC